jgi:hypothetical protein
MKILADAQDPAILTLSTFVIDIFYVKYKTVLFMHWALDLEKIRTRRQI